MKHTNAAARGVRVPTNSLCTPMKKFFRLSLFTASYTGEFFSPFTVGRADTLWSGSMHVFIPGASYMATKPSCSFTRSHPRKTTAPWSTICCLISVTCSFR